MMEYLFNVNIFNDFLPPIHILVQIVLFIFVLWLFFKKSEKEYIGYPKQEEDNIIENWKPKPLVEAEDFNKVEETLVIRKKVGKYIYMEDIKYLNLASYNFLGLLENSTSEELAVKSVKKYGIGSCGPRGFYGTVDVHLQLEADLAAFMGTEEVIVYSYGFSTSASAIPAYAKKSDIIFVDENVNFSIQKGLDASRSEIVYFDHNNIEHLEKLLAEQAVKDSKNQKKSKKMRKFLVVEGIYNKSGDICPLPEMIRLKRKFNIRLFIDESLSFGTLGSTGRGITEHFHIPISEVDLIMSSMENSLATIGGFCAGSSYIIEHQRLSGLGYCFSASLPPPLTVVAISNLKTLNENPSLVSELATACETVQRLFNKSRIIMKHFIFKGDILSPIKHLIPKNESTSETLLNQIIDCSLKNRVALTKAVYLSEDKKPCDPSIRLSVMNALTVYDINHVINTFESVLLDY